MTKFLSDDWMWEHKFADYKGVRRDAPWWHANPVGSLKLNAPCSILPAVTCKNAVDLMTKQGFDQLPVVSAENEVLGVVTAGNLAAKLFSQRIKPSDPVGDCLYKQFKSVSMGTTLGDLSRYFEKDHFALVTASQQQMDATGAMSSKQIVCGVVSRIDLLNHISSKTPGSSPAPVLK